MEKVNLSQKFSLFSDYWSPKIAGELNDSHVKLVKLKGEFVWHHHETEDELFYVVKGRFRMEYRDRSVWIEQGEFVIVPRMVWARAGAGPSGPSSDLRRMRAWVSWRVGAVPAETRRYKAARSSSVRKTR